MTVDCHNYHKYIDDHIEHFSNMYYYLSILLCLRVLCCIVFLQAMVQYNRLDLLTHPVCQKYLEMKW